MKWYADDEWAGGERAGNDWARRERPCGDGGIRVRNVRDGRRARRAGRGGHFRRFAFGSVVMWGQEPLTLAGG